MEKKKRDISLPKRFNSEDVKKWQEQANLTTGGNLTLWMENALNTIYFMHNDDAPSHNQQDEIVKAIERQEWVNSSISIEDVSNYKIDLSIFDNQDAYNNIVEKLKEYNIYKLETTTIYKIIGGGQRVRQNSDLGLDTTYEVVENSDYVEKAGCHGQDFFANTMWSTSLDNLQRWANEWAGKKVKLVKKD